MGKLRMPMVLLLTAFFVAVWLLGGEESESFKEAKILFTDAIKQKNSGNLTEAVKLYEKAIRKNRGILSFDDEGLINELKNYYEKLLASSPEDLKILEPLGFIYAVCYSDFEKAIGYYEKVASLTQDEKVKTKTEALIARLQAQLELAKAHGAVTDNRSRDEKITEWKELEKQQALSELNERIRNREDKIRELTRKKEDLETRIPQTEEKIKDLQEERDKADLYYRTTQRGMYRRKRENFEKEIEATKRTLSVAKKELDRVTEELERLTKEAKQEQAAIEAVTNASVGRSSSEDDEDLSEEESAQNQEGSQIHGTTQTAVTTAISNSNSVPSDLVNPTEFPPPPDDLPLPPMENPDFPNSQDSNNNESKKSEPTKWP